MPVTISTNVQDVNCVNAANQLRPLWANLLAAQGRTGHYLICHGWDHPCAKAHDIRFARSLYIGAVDSNGDDSPQCPVFRSRKGNAINYAGARRVGEGATVFNGAWAGQCNCGGGHP